MSSIVSPARAAASDVLLSVATERSFATPLLASDRLSGLSREDRALTHELVLGVLRWQRQLDYLITRYANRQLEKIDLKVLTALRLAIYQLRFLSRIPAHAAINEAVNLVRSQRLKSAAPFANAVLRAAQREISVSIAELLGLTLAEIDRAGIELSIPEWLLRRWQKRFGDLEARELALSLNQTPRTSLRFNPRQKSVEDTTAWLQSNGIELAPSELSQSAFVVTRGNISGESQPVRNGWLYLQDESSQLVAMLAEAHWMRIRRGPDFLTFAPRRGASLRRSLRCSATIHWWFAAICIDIGSNRSNPLQTNWQSRI